MDNALRDKQYKKESVVVEESANAEGQGRRMDKQWLWKKGTGKERLEEGGWTCLAEVKFGMGWDGDGVWRWCGNWEKGKSGSWPEVGGWRERGRPSDWRVRAGGGMMKEDTPVSLTVCICVSGSALEANEFAPWVVFFFQSAAPPALLCRA